MAAFTRYYPIVGAKSVSVADGPFFYEPTGETGGYVRGPWDKRFGTYSYGTWWWLSPYQTSDDYGTSTQSQFYTIPATPSPFRWHVASWVTPRLAAQTLGGTFDLIMGVSQSHASCQFGWRVVIWVSKGPYFLPERGLALDYTEPAGRPLPLVSTGWGLPTPQALAPIVCEAGDYLSIEVGVIAYAAPGVSRAHNLEYAPSSGPLPSGTPNPLLTVGSTAVFDHAGHVLFSQPLALLDPPPNDACATPIIIASTPFVSPPDPIGATLATYTAATDMIATCGYSGGTYGEGLYNTLWWRWTAPSTGTLRLEPALAGGDSALTAYTGSCGAFTQIGCAVGYNGSVPLLKLAVTAGTTYHFRMGGRSNFSALHVHLKGRYVTVPTNDLFANRIVISALPFAHTTDLTLATVESGEQTSPADWTSTPAQSVWYQWTADATAGHIRVNTMGSAFDSQVTIWTGTWGAFTEVFSAPWTNTIDGDQYYDQANCVFRPTPGVTYYITVFSGGGSAYDNNGGDALTLTISRVTPPLNETCATAFTIPAIPYYGTHDNTNAADGQMETVPLGECDWFTMEDNDSGKVLWFKWTADRTAAMNLNTYGPPNTPDVAGPFSELILYTGSCGTLVPIACDTHNMVEQTQLYFNAIVGTTYYLRMTSNGRIEGRMYLFLDEDYADFQTGDVVVCADWVWVLTPAGALRSVEAIGAAIPTGSGLDPETGLLSVADWYYSRITRVNGRLQAVGDYLVSPGKTPEVPGFFRDGRLYVGHWGDWAALAGIDGLVDSSFAIRRFDPNTGALEVVHMAKQEYYGTAWIDPAADQRTIHYCSRGRRIMGYDIAAGAQLPDVTTLPGTFPTYRARGLRHRANGEFLVADAAEVKRVSAAGTVVQSYPIDGRDDLNVLDQDPEGLTVWVGDQDTSEVYRVDIATGAILLKVPGGPFHSYGNGHDLCGLTVIGGYRTGPAEPPPVLEVCVSGDFPIDSPPLSLCVDGGFPIDPGTGPVEPPIEPPAAPRIPAGSIMVGGFADSATFRFLSPDGATSYAPPSTIPTFTDLVVLGRTSAGHIMVCGAYAAPYFGATGSGLLKASDLSVLSEKTTGIAVPSGLAADALGYWYVMMLAFPDGEVAQIRRLDTTSTEVAAWNIPIPLKYKSAYIWALAVNDAGTLAYAWMNPDFFVYPSENAQHTIHTFSLAGSGSYLGILTPDYQSHPTYGSLLIVPDGSGDIIAAFGKINGTTGGALKRYTPAGTVVWTAGTPAGAVAGEIFWAGVTRGLLSDTHFLAWAYDGNVDTATSARYCWFSYATGTPDNTRNFTPEDGSFEFDSQFVVLSVAIP